MSNWHTRRTREVAADGLPNARMKVVVYVAVANSKLLPTWVKPNLIPGLASVPNQYWLTPVFAKSLLNFMAGIHVPARSVKTAMYRCAQCNRPTVGSEAIDLVTKIESKSADKTCGPNCAKDALSNLWSILRDIAA